MRLTEAGMLLRERAEDILSLVDKTEAEFKSLEEINSGDIYIGAPESEAMSLFADIVCKLQKDHPKIRCNIYSGNMQDVCEKLDKGLLDFAIVLNYVDLTKYNCLPMSTKDNWGVIFRNDDILSKKKSFSISDLRDLPLICSKQWVDYELPDWFEYNLKDVNIVATYNLPPLERSSKSRDVYHLEKESGLYSNSRPAHRETKRKLCPLMRGAFYAENGRRKKSSPSAIILPRTRCNSNSYIKFFQKIFHTKRPSHFSQVLIAYPWWQYGRTSFTAFK